MSRFRPASLRSLAFALAVFACAPASADADSRLKVFGYVREQPVDTVPDSVIDDWKYLDDRNVLVFRNSKAYLLVLTSACPDLQSAGVIGFNAALSGLVAAKTLVVGSRSTSAECGVEQIVQLRRDAAALSAPPAPRPAAPRPAPAAPAPAPRPAPTAAPAPAPVAPAAPTPPAPAPPPAAAPSDEPPPPAAAPAPPPESTPPSRPLPPRIDRPVATPPGATPL